MHKIAVDNFLVSRQQEKIILLASSRILFAKICAGY